MNELPTSIWQGSFHIFGVEIRCHMLSNGKRIIEAESMNKLFEAMASGDCPRGGVDEEIRRFAAWQRGGE